MATKPKYVVTDASIYTVRPVVTEHRYRMIEEVKPQPELGPFAKFVCAVLGVMLGLWLVVTVGGWFGYH
jgi:hypothetical protein